MDGPALTVRVFRDLLGSGDASYKSSKGAGDSDTFGDLAIFDCVGIDVAVLLLECLIRQRQRLGSS
jgi:hypothetical protein